MKTIRIFSCIFLLLFLFTTIFADSFKIFWWVVAPSADVCTLGGAINGTTSGQTAIGPIETGDHAMKGNLGFWSRLYGNPDFLCFCINDSIWFVDSIDSREYGGIYSMGFGDRFRIANCGNVHVNPGLEVDTCEPLNWSPGYSPARDRFVIKARFNDSEIPPINYHTANCHIKDTRDWADGTRFGPGQKIALQDSLNLWFQFIVPLSITYDTTYVFPITNRIKVLLWGRPLLP